MADRPLPSRRDLLRFSLGLALLSSTSLSGCTFSSPTIDSPGRASGSPTPSASGTPQPTPAPTPTVAPASRSSATRERGLAVLSAAIVSGRQGTALTKDQRSLLRSVRAAHRSHADALDPDGPPAKAAKISDLSLPQALSLLARRERAAAKAHRKTALTSSGLHALRLGSMSVAAAGFATAVTDASPAKVTSAADDRPPPLLSDVEAVQALVGQLHAVVYGYQLAIGQMPAASGPRGRAVRELRSTRVERDRLIAWLKRRKADIPAAEAAYVPTVVPRDGASAAKLIRAMHIALLPFYGQWLAAAGDADRKRALTTLTSAAGRADSWRAPLAPRPGYPPS
ncbi:MAG TPA: DUF4439 domain-containing protein [Propionibacteriaceae bacterium]|nr:DUF4439 domain-containing protein [Propionibacteriaceae bacterium]